MKEYQVSLSLPVEALDVAGAVAEFRWDVANGPAYVYGVDTGEELLSYDTENRTATAGARIDKGTLDALAEKLYATAHDQPSDADGIGAIRTELYKLLGMV
jgi:hypothetical protein